MRILGIGNVLEKDDGVGVYAASFLQANYTFSPELSIINGGVEGINLFNHFVEDDHIVILDSVALDDDPGSIYVIPGEELVGRGLNVGGAHEVGVIQCLDMLELQGIEPPVSRLIGIVPAEVTFEMALSDTIEAAFEGYIKVILRYLSRMGFKAIRKEEAVKLEAIIERAKDPSGVMLSGDL